MTQEVPLRELYDVLLYPRQAVRRVAEMVDGAEFVHAAWRLANNPGPARPVGFVLLLEEELLRIGDFLAAASDLQALDLRRYCSGYVLMSALARESILLPPEDEPVGARTIELGSYAEDDDPVGAALVEAIPRLVAEASAEIAGALRLVAEGCQIELARLTDSELDEDAVDTRRDLIADALEYAEARLHFIEDVYLVGPEDAAKDHFPLLESWYGFGTRLDPG